MGGDMMGGDMSQMMSMMNNMTAMMSAHTGMMAPYIEGRIATLKAELKITSTQTPQWNRFADALRTAGNSMNHADMPMMHSGSATTLPARLAARQAMLATHLTALGALKSALDPLYASFSDEQKKIADRLMIGPMGMM